MLSVGALFGGSRCAVVLHLSSLSVRMYLYRSFFVSAYVFVFVRRRARLPLLLLSTSTIFRPLAFFTGVVVRRIMLPSFLSVYHHRCR